MQFHEAVDRRLKVTYDNAAAPGDVVFERKIADVKVFVMPHKHVVVQTIENDFATKLYPETRNAV